MAVPTDANLFSQKLVSIKPLASFYLPVKAALVLLDEIPCVAAKTLKHGNEWKSEEWVSLCVLIILAERRTYWGTLVCFLRLVIYGIIYLILLCVVEFPASHLND